MLEAGSVHSTPPLNTSAITNALAFPSPAELEAARRERAVAACEQGSAWLADHPTRRTSKQET
jgi:hypothetical protein